MFRSITIAGAAAAILVGGALTAVAANNHASPVSKVVSGLSGEARGDAVSAAARLHGDAKSDAARADDSARDADVDSDAAAKASDESTDKAGTTDKDAHGDAVSAVASNSSLVRPCTHHGKTVTNHGCAVRTAAHNS